MNDVALENFAVDCLPCKKDNKPQYWTRTATYGIGGVRMAQLVCSGCSKVIDIRIPKLVAMA